MIKKQLQQEFQWLQQQYPITFTQDFCLHIISTDEPQSSSVFFELENNSWMIHMEIPAQPIFDNYDVERLSRYMIPETEDSYFFMLYHEYGHIWEMETKTKERGYEKAVQYMQQYEKDVNRIITSFESDEISEEEMNQQYETLSPEKFAESFAIRTYEKRKRSEC